MYARHYLYFGVPMLLIGIYLVVQYLEPFLINDKDADSLFMVFSGSILIILGLGVIGKVQQINSMMARH